MSIIVLIAAALHPAVASLQDDKYRVNPTPDPKSKYKVYVPASLEDAFKELEKMLHPDLLKEMKEGKEEGMIEHHMGLGIWMRNNWGLWGGSRLKDYFNKLGIFHADDMSSIILSTFWCHLNSKPLKLEERIAYFKEYWRVNQEPKNQRCPKDSSPIRFDAILTGETENGLPEAKHVGRCRKHRHLWVYEVDKGLYEPDASLMKRISG